MKKDNIIFKDPIMVMTKNSLVSLPTPTSISFLWNMGFLLGMTLMLQVMTGLVLSMNYVSSVDMAYCSVIHIMRDVECGHIMRYMHMNGASLFFILLYSHVSRGIYFNSPKKMPMVWSSGVWLLLMAMGTAFMGYVLPWGQMSFWGATVITSMLSAIPYLGLEMTQWLWGNFSVSQPTLNRFFSLHFMLPMVMLSLVLIHLIFLHSSGSSNPLGLSSNFDKMKFFPYFALKDMIPLIFVLMMIIFIISMNPEMLGDVENFNPASMAVTPPHIQPEWYFLFAYAILRSIPSKLGGVVAMMTSILMLMMMMVVSKKSLNKKFSPKNKTLFWMFLAVVLLLSWVGANPVEPPFVATGQTLTLLYFLLALFM